MVDAGCKTVIGMRLKRSGMLWTVRGANSIIALRCSRLSGPISGLLGIPLPCRLIPNLYVAHPCQNLGSDVLAGTVSVQ